MKNIELKQKLFISAILLVLFMIAPAMAGTVIPDEVGSSNPYFITVANDGGASADLYGDDTYAMYFFSGNFYGLIFKTDNSYVYGDQEGENLLRDANDGSFYLDTYSGKGGMQKVILMLAVNGTVPDDFKAHFTATGYNVSYSSTLSNYFSQVTYSDISYEAGVDEEFTKSDFIYGPQVTRPKETAIYHEQDVSNTEDTFQIMFIDTGLGIVGNKVSNYGNIDNNVLTDGGKLKIDYHIENLGDSVAVIDAYGWVYSGSDSPSTLNPSISWTNSRSTDGEVRILLEDETPVDPPVANFTASTASGEAPLTVQFADNSTGSPTSWSWDFGDGGSSTEQNPEHIYNNAGTYTVSLTATNSAGSDTKTMTDYITVGVSGGSLLADSPYPEDGLNSRNSRQSAYNGPLAQGVAEKWALTTVGDLYVTPIIDANGIIYVGSNKGKKVSAIYPNGTTKWTYTTNNRIYNAPAITSDGTLYFNDVYTIYAINTSDKSSSWSGSGLGYYINSPTIGPDGTIYDMNRDSTLSAIDPTGEVKYYYSNSALKGSSSGFYYVTVAIGPDGTVYLAGYNGCLYAFYPDLTVKWFFNTDGSGAWTKPAVGPDGTVYLMSKGGYIYAINPEDGSQKWRYKAPSTTFDVGASPSVASDGTIYYAEYNAGGNLTAVNPDDGTVKWTYVLNDGQVYGPPLIGADGTIYYGTYNGNVYAVNSDGTLKWKHPVGGNIYSTPSIGSDGTLYIGTTTGLYAIENVVDFTADMTSGDNPLTVQFTGTSSRTVSSWLWDFGDGATSNVQSPSHTYNSAGSYNVTLTIMEDGTGETFTANKPAYINTYTTPVAAFNADVTTGKVPMTVSFTDLSANNPTSWSWDFGDGNTSSKQDPEYTYLTLGTYSVTLTVENPAGNSKEVKNNYITIGAQSVPVVEFNASVTEGQAPLEVDFTDLSTGSPISWSWDFGNGATSDEKNPTQTYAVPGIYTVDLSATNYGGSNNTIKADFINVTPQDPPAVSFDATNITITGDSATNDVPVPLTIQFNQNATGYNITSYLWDFGDGFNSIEENPVHTYESAGDYTINLTVSNDGGSETEILNLTIVGIVTPVADFSVNKTYGINPLTVKFIDESLNDPISWSWNFGDGETSTKQNPVHTYTNIGTYNVILTATNSAGSNTTVKTDYVISSTTNAQPLSNYRNINIYVANDEGVKWDEPDGLTRYEGIGIPYNYEPNTYFVLFGTSGGGSNPMDISNVPDGLKGIDGQITETPNQSGEFYVTFSGGQPYMHDGILMLAVNGTIPDDFSVHIRSSGYDFVPPIPSIGNNNSISTPVYTEGAVDQAFTIDDFIYGPQIWKPFGTENYPIYTGQDMSDTENTFQLMFIDLNLGATQTGTDQGSIKVEYEFNNLTSFAVFNSYGWYRASNHGTGIIMTNCGSYYAVIGISKPPVADFTVSNTTGYTLEPLQFTDISNDNPQSWFWDFGDGINSTEQNPEHAYSSDGIYNVTLTVTNLKGNDSKSKDIVQIFRELPEVSFTADVTLGISPFEVTFTDETTNYPLFWLWDFGDGTSSTEQNPVHWYAPGLYSVSLTATNGKGDVTLVKTDYICVSSNGVNEKIINPDFETSDLTGWESGSYASISGNKVHEGNYSVFFNFNGGYDPYSKDYIAQHIDMTDVSSVSFWGYQDGSATQQFNTYIDGELVQVDACANTWTQYTIPVSNYTGVHEIRIGFNFNQQAVHSYIDDFSIVAETSAPVARFIATGNNSGESPLEVKFMDTSSNYPTSWAWDFNNDGIVDSTEQNPEHIYTDAGTYSVNLTVSNDEGSSTHTEEDYIVVSGGDVSTRITNPGFETGDTTGWQVSSGEDVSAKSDQVHSGSYSLFLNYGTGSYASQTIDLTGVSSISYWNYGKNNQYFKIYIDGELVQQDTAVKAWNQCTVPASDFTGSHEFKIEFEYSGKPYAGYIDDLTLEPEVSPPPVANFTATPTSGDSPLTVQFTDESLNDPGEWLWNFGDGETSTEQSPEHIYTDAGTYSVNLTVSNDGGSSTHTEEDYILVSGGDVSTRITNPGFETGDVTGWQVSSGEDVSAKSDQVHSGSYSLFLNYGTGSYASQTIDLTGVSSISYWNYGKNNQYFKTYIDGELVQQDTAVKTWNQCTIPVSDYTGSHEFKIEFEYSGKPYAGYIDDLTLEPEVSSPPVANFTANVTSGDSPLTVQFTDASLNDPTSWSWDFNNDGVVDSTEQNPEHIYTDAGTYSVNLTVSNDGGSSTHIEEDYIVVSGDVSTRITNPGFETGDTTGWQVSSGEDVSAKSDQVHSGSYSLFLNYGTGSYASQTIDLTGVSSISFWNYGKNNQYFKTYIDGELVQQDTAVKTWNQCTVPVSDYTGSHELKIEFEYSGKPYAGYIDDLTLEPEVSSPPVANFTANVTSGDSPLTVQFTDESLNDPAEWLWNFGDGETSTDQNPEHIYTDAGTYSVNLTVTNDAGTNSEMKADYITVISLSAKIELPQQNGLNLTVVDRQRTSVYETEEPGTYFFNIGNGQYNGGQNAIHISDSYLTADGTITTETNTTGTFYITDTGGKGYEDEAVLLIAIQETDSSKDFSIDIVASGYKFEDHEANVMPTEAEVGTFNGQAYVATLNAADFLTYDGVLVSQAWKPSTGSVGDINMKLFDGQDLGGQKYNFIIVDLNTSIVGRNAAYQENLVNYGNPKVAYTIHDYSGGNVSFVPYAWVSYQTGGGSAFERTVGWTSRSNSASWVVNLAEGGSGTALAANFTASKTSGYAPLFVSFTDTSTGSPSSWHWDFGDGSTSTDQNTTHTFTTAGTYSVNLTVAADGESSSFERTITVITTSGEVGLADSAWPEFGFDSRNTGQSPYTGPQTNATKWIYSAGGTMHSTGPAIGTDGTIYIPNAGNDLLYAFNPDGTVKWTYNAGTAYGTPAIGADGTIYIGNYDNKNLQAINPDGTLKWKSGASGIVRGSPAIATDGTIYLGNALSDILAFNPDGSLKWIYYQEGNMVSSLAFGSDGTIYFGNSEINKLYALNPDGTEKWSFATGGYVRGTPSVDTDGTIYFGSGDHKLYALNPDGTEKWSYTTGGGIRGTPAIATDGTIYVTNYDDNKLYAFTRDGTLKWSSVAGKMEGSPVIGADGTIYIGSADNNFYAFNSDGTLKWSYNTGGEIRASSAAIGSDGTLYISNRNGDFFAFNTPEASVAGFSATPTSGDAPLQVQFTDESSNSPTSWSWDFDNDGIVDSTEQNPSYTYATAGTYSVNLTIGSSFGNDSELKTGYITVSSGSSGGAAPVSAFSATPVEGEAPLQVQFTDESVNSPTSWFWDFDNDGVVDSTEQNPSYTYATAGTYSVNLTAANDAGTDTEIKTDYITVTGGSQGDESPVASFIAVTPRSGLAPLTVSFNDTSLNGPIEWLWDFGDGTTSTEQNPTHLYTTAGTYNVTLTATNSNGTDTSTADRYIAALTEDPMSDYRNINIYVANDEGVKWDEPDGLTRYEGIGIPYNYVPNTYFVLFGTPGGGTNPMDISSDPDGQKGRVGQITETYDQSGEFWVTFNGGQSYMHEGVLMLAVNGTIPEDFNVRIRSSGYDFVPPIPSVGNNDSISDPVYVEGAVDQTFTVDDFIYGPQIWKPFGLPDYPIYTGQDMTDNENTFQIMFVDLNLGATKTGTDQGSIKVEYEFNNLTSFAVFNSFGWYRASNHGTGIIMTNCDSYYAVTGIPDSPLAGFTAEPVTGEIPLTVQFTDTSSGVPTEWSWDFDGDGVVDSTEQNPEYTYTAMGTYPVSLTVENYKGTDSILKEELITVKGHQQASGGVEIKNNGTITDNGDGTINYSVNQSQAQVKGNDVVIDSGGYTLTYKSDTPPTVVGGNIVTTVTEIELETDPVETTLDEVGNVSGTIDLALNDLPDDSSLQITLTKGDSGSGSDFRLAASTDGLSVDNVAYTMNVVKTNLTNGQEIKEAKITMSVPVEWVNANGGVDAIKIIRVAEDGKKEVLATRHMGTANGVMTFEGYSPNGLSLFGLAAVSTRDTTPSSGSVSSSGGGKSDQGIDSAEKVKAGETATLVFDKTSIYEIDFYAKSDIPELLVTIESGAKPGDDLTEGDVYDYLYAGVYKAPEGSIEKDTIRFTVPSAWVDKRISSPDLLSLWYYDESSGDWNKLSTVFEKEEGGLCYYFADSAELGYLAIAAQPDLAVLTPTPLPEQTAPIESESTPAPSQPAATPKATPLFGGFTILAVAMLLLSIIAMANRRSGR